VAAIDCGTNSIRLLVADIDGTSGELVDIARMMRIVRLGQGVDASGRLAEDALARTFAACEAYAAVIARHEVARVRFVATSATRDAENRDDFVAGVRQRLAVEPEVVTGQEEAALSFVGATSEIEDALPPYLVVDIGGGSTEFVLGTDAPVAAVSLDIGCVRMTERHLHADPPTEAEVAAATADIDAAVRRGVGIVPVGVRPTLVGLAGSVTTVAAIALDLPTYDPAQIHRSRVQASAVEEVSGRLLRMTRAERAALPVVHPGRVDVIAAGALVLARIVALSGAPEVVVSEHDILDGIARSLVPATPAA
jgi:exopolyphosphatase/guanosine-5'-triphosphate,3'-diphosphate pyrophosphatase